MGCPTHVLKNKVGKFEPRSQIRLFVGYSKETRGGYFYSPQDNKVLVLTNTTFLEDNYMIDHKPHGNKIYFFYNEIKFILKPKAQHVNSL